MTRLFRNIRQKLVSENRSVIRNTNYFKYALGEIVLVVIGILIALQINNWNENRKEQASASKYAWNLKSDLEQDIRETNIRIKQMKRGMSYIDSTAAYFRDKTIQDLTNIDVMYETYISAGYKPFTWYKATFEEIKSSGSLNSIKNDTLRNKIIAYYAFTEHLDQDFIGDDDNQKKYYAYLNRIINSNYPNQQELVDSIRIYHRRSKKEWLASQSYKTARKENLHLLTDNMNDIHVCINVLFDSKGGMITRSEVELPDLIDDANEIISIIEREYHD